MPAAIAVRRLTKRYGSTVAAHDIHFEVQDGEIFGLIGPNGAGKTTVLECILGLIRPDSGEISVRGIDARAQPALAKEKLGAQLQTSALPGLAWAALDPAGGSVVRTAPELGLAADLDEGIVRTRSAVYAVKFLGRVRGQINN
jgi:energy-coupling factor transporter ATP-binding protein EcfA2